jgi:hypothetical protein
MLRQDGVTITQLDNIGGNIAGNSVLPIVRLQDDTTYKTSVNLLGNYILNTVAPNVTVNLGDVSNIIINGGSNGFVLHTYGNGHLYWGVDDDAFPGGPNTAVQFNNNNEFAGSGNFTFNSSSNTLAVQGTVVANNINSANFSGNFSSLNGESIVSNNVNSANFSGNFSSLTGNTVVANSISANDISGNVGTLTVANIIADYIQANTINGNLGNLTAGNIIADYIEANTVSTDNLEILSAGAGTSQQVLGIINQSTQQLGWKTVPVYYVNVELRNGDTYLSSPNPVLRVYPVMQRDGSFVTVNTTQI